jgi:hypothetical protein
MNNNQNSPSIIAGLAIILSMVTGLAAMIVALFAVINDFNWLAGGLSLGAAALAFGLVANAILRE